ncbi:MAG: hypothetical protein KDD53_06280, partial [Bdellovibrionales bacterium]|nr:hypothetical protein [Bdellovibrionales bacterium]
YHPEIFEGDLITNVMEGYLTPIHYWLSYGITLATKSPIMTGHWVMLIQAVFALGFLFLAVRAAAGVAPALISVAWLIHTRHIMQRLTAGLPRGWAAGVLTAGLYFLFKKNHSGMLILLAVGCFLHPPATLVIAVAYGIQLSFGLINKSTRDQFRRPFIRLLLLSPLYVASVFFVVHRPAEIGQMVTLEQAASMPEFQNPGGRFPFVPLQSVSNDFHTFGFQAFTGRFFDPDKNWKDTFLDAMTNSNNFWERNADWIIIAGLGLLISVSLLRKRSPFPGETWYFLISLVIVYFASRLLAFKLYVPNRHLQFPMAIFFIAAFSIAAWRAFYSSAALKRTKNYSNSSLKAAWGSAFALAGVAFCVVLFSGSGLRGAANFNYASTKKGQIFHWLKDNTPEASLIAGHPTFIDGVMLFAMRKGFVTSEVSHPFYQGYYKEMDRRLQISLKAHYAKDLRQLVEVLDPEGVDYFVFERRRFMPDQIVRQRYYAPLDVLVKDLTSGPERDYAYFQLPETLDSQKFPFLVFKDKYAVVIDVKKLRRFLKDTSSKESQLRNIS